MSENCHVIVSFLIFCQFGAVQRPDSGHRVKLSVIVTLFLQKLKTELKNLQHSSYTITLNKGT